MPSGCETCPRCGEETLQPYPNRASCLRVVDCGYSERRDNDTKDGLRAQVARRDARIAALEAVLRERTPDNPYEGGGTCSFCGSYDDHYPSCSWQRARALLSDEGERWLEVREQVRLVITTFNGMLATKLPDEEIVGVMDGLLDNLGVTLDALGGT